MSPFATPASVDETECRAADPDPRFTVEVDAVRPEDWDRVVGSFDDGSYDQTAGHVAARWGLNRASHVLVRRDGVPVAGAIVVILAWAGVRRGIAYVKFGPFWRRAGAAPDIGIYRRSIAALVDEFCSRRGHCLTVLPRVNPEYYADECRILRELGFRVRRPLHDPNRYILDVRLDPAIRIASLDQKWRYNLRRALGNGIECRLGDGEADLIAFTRMHARMVARKGFADPDALHVLPSLASRLPTAMHPRLVLARHHGTTLAGAIVGVCGDTAFYAFGASDDPALPLRAGYALQWWIVNWLSELGVRWYDLGGEAGDPGLRQFKKGFVGKGGAIVSASGEFDRWTTPSGRLAGDAIYKLRDVWRALRSRPSRRPAERREDA